MTTPDAIDLDLPRKLRDREYRRRFFRAESSAQIAEDLINLRKRRGLNQTQLAELTGTKHEAAAEWMRALSTPQNPGINCAVYSQVPPYRMRCEKCLAAGRCLEVATPQNPGAAAPSGEHKNDAL